ncbi:MAG: TMEM43 family protein [Rickettsiales bacterium]|nr:TMEM43 family protein [Pseudomonadota bacterium]MDA0966243.1 TMEM43 family protein [Pseudomonadota bacterium]MDG4543092.1 TMEM43 family protein [Rickettsiales bacterium]MDG4545290.1 TMEM43 family protein [Rickettsiales bacterium]MDG4547739.1 TMEM43 family protein [Rickettsiales bacterium]
MLRKQPKSKTKVSSGQPTKGGWQMDKAEKNKGSGIKNLFKMMLLFLGVGLIGVSFFLSSDGGVASITADEKNNDNNGKLVHVTGKLSSKALEDPMFLIGYEGVGLKRIVEMYQWVESNGEYAKEWKSEIVALSEDASDKVNPPEMSFLSESWKVEKVDLGTFGLSESIVEKVVNYTPLELNQENFSKLNQHGQAAFKLHEGMYFWGHDQNNPLIGDIRVRFEVAEAATYSVLAKQTGGNLSAYSDGGATIEKVARGNVSLETMLKGVDSVGGGIMPLILRVIGGISFVLFVLTIVLGKKNSSKAAKEQVADGKEAVSDNQPQQNTDSIPASTENKTAAIDDGFNSDNIDDEVLEDIEMQEDGYGYEPEDTGNENAMPPSLAAAEETYDNFSDDIPENIDMPYEDDDDDNEVPEGIEIIGGDDFEEESPRADSSEFESSPEEYETEDDNETSEGIEIIEEELDELPETDDNDSLEFESLSEDEQEDDNEPEGIEIIDEDDFEEEVPKKNSLEFEPSSKAPEPDDNEVPEAIDIIEEGLDVLPETEDDSPLEFEPLSEDKQEYDDIIIEDFEEEFNEGGTAEAENAEEVPDLPNPREFLNKNPSGNAEENLVEEDEVSFEIDAGNIPDNFDPNAEMEIDTDEDIEIDYDAYIDEEPDTDTESNDEKK